MASQGASASGAEIHDRVFVGASEKSHLAHGGYRRCSHIRRRQKVMDRWRRGRQRLVEQPGVAKIGVAKRPRPIVRGRTSLDKNKNFT